MKAPSTSPVSPLKIALWSVLIVVLFLLPLWARCFYESSVGLAAGDSARQDGDLRAAVRAYGRAVRWRAVLNPYAEQAQGKLLALKGELSGEELVFLLKELRRSLYLSRNFYLSSGDDQALIADIDKQLVTLGARNATEVKLIKSFTLSFNYQLLSQIAFWGWVCLTLVTIRRGFSRHGKLNAGPFVLSAGASLLFFVFWLLMLSRA